jgi:hypothetical protein
MIFNTLLKYALYITLLTQIALEKNVKNIITNIVKSLT